MVENFKAFNKEKALAHVTVSLLKCPFRLGIVAFKTGITPKYDFTLDQGQLSQKIHFLPSGSKALKPEV